MVPPRARILLQGKELFATPGPFPKIHVRLTKRHQCPYCEKDYKRPGTLDAHIKDKHAGRQLDAA